MLCTWEVFKSFLNFNVLYGDPLLLYFFFGRGERLYVSCPLVLTHLMWTVIGRKAFLVVTQLNGLKNPLPLDSAHAFDLAALSYLYRNRNVIFSFARVPLPTEWTWRTFARI